MTRGILWSRRRVLPYLAAWASLAAIPGCGGEAPKGDAPPAKKEDNNEMLNFMKSQQKAKK
jgi:hypothetical protein